MTLEQLANLYIEALEEDAQAHRTGHTAVVDATPTAPRIGDLWMTRGIDGGELPAMVMVTSVGDAGLRALIVLDEPALAGLDDLLVQSASSPTGTALALCLWCEVPLAPDALSILVGALPDDVVEPALMLLQGQLTGGFRPEPVGSERLTTGEPASRWVITSEAEPERRRPYLTGAMIFRPDDPRTKVRDVIRRHTQYLERDAIAAVLTIAGVLGIATGWFAVRCERRAESLSVDSMPPG